MNYLSGPLAQLVEQFPFKEWVDGSSPSRLTINLIYVKLIGGYSNIIPFIHSLSFSIRVSDDGCVLMN